MEGGAFLAYALADVLDVAFLPAYRAPAPAAGTGAATAYRLALAGDAAGGIAGWRVAIADDAINAGTAVRACAQQLRDQGAVPVAIATLLSLGPASEATPAALSVPLHWIETVQSQAWPADECPLCASGTALTDPSSAALKPALGRLGGE